MKKKRTAKAPVNQMTLDYCRTQGWLIGWTEYKVRYNITKDLFGFIDFVAIRPGTKGVLALQVTTFENRLARIKKICTETREAAESWVLAGNQIEVWGWKRPNTTQSTWALNRDCVIMYERDGLRSIDVPLETKSNTGDK